MELKTKNYQDLNDSELVYMINENSEDAKDVLYSKYSALIHKELNRVRPKAYALGVEWSDLMQEALLGFSNAINTYDESADVKFITYATLCIRRKIINFLEKHATYKNKAISNAFSIDDDDSMIAKNIKDIDGREPLNSIITNEELDEVNRKLDKLNEAERVILELTIAGNKPEEIAEIMSIPVKQVYNKLYRARQKIKVE